MSSWTNVHKWVVRYSDDKSPNLKELSKYTEIESVTATTDRGNLPLHLAAIGEQPTVLQYLVETMPFRSLNQGNKKGETALHWACRSGYLANVQTLLDAGVEIKPDKKGNTILHFAVESGSVSIVRYILDNKLIQNVNSKNCGGKTAIAVACEEQEIPLIRILKQHGAQPGSLIRQYVAKNETKIVKVLSRGTKLYRGATEKN